jgi:DNA-3-methyladenine glycosylase II
MIQASGMEARVSLSHSRYDLPVTAPYRLDLTVSVLRRLSTNLVDLLTENGQYVRALAVSGKPVIARVRQTRRDALAVTLDGDERVHARALALVRRTLGVDHDLAHFNQAVTAIPWLNSLATRMRGVRPPRYPTLWEACVNAIVFQQVSLHAASAIMHRLIVALQPSVHSGGVSLYQFPTAETVLRTDDHLLRAAGLSSGKLATLRRVAELLAAGTLDESMLETLESHDAAALLRGIKGIGPWTAAVILLRGLGRLDVFPMNDTSVARNLALVGGSGPLDVEGVLHALSPQQGMLYYHLLLARLETRNDLGRASVSASSNVR